VGKYINKSSIRKKQKKKDGKKVSTCRRIVTTTLFSQKKKKIFTIFIIIHGKHLRIKEDAILYMSKKKTSRSNKSRQKKKN
jgi:hypothetical protein